MNSLPNNTPCIDCGVIITSNVAYLTWYDVDHGDDVFVHLDCTAIDTLCKCGCDDQDDNDV